MKKIIFTFIAVFQLNLAFSFSQELSYTDSLKVQLKEENDKINRANILMDIGSSLPLDDSIAIFSYYNQAMNIAMQEKDSILIGKLYVNISRFYYYKYMPDKAVEFMIRAEQIFRVLPGKKAAQLLITAMGNRAAMLGANGKIEEQQSLYFELIPLFQEIKDSVGLSNAYMGIATVFYNKDQLHSSHEYFYKSLEVFDNKDIHSELLGEQILNMAMICIRMDSLEQGEKYLKIAKDRLFGADTLFQWAKYHFLQGEKFRKEYQYEQALSSYKNGLEIARKFGNIHYITNMLMGMTDVHLERREFALALPLMEEYHDITLELKDFAFQKTALESLADIHYNLKNPEQAYYYLQKHKVVVDSLNETEITNRLHQLTKQFESVQREKQIADLQYEKERTEWRLHRNQLILILSLFGLGTAAGAGILYFRNYKIQKKMNKQNDQLHLMEVAQIKQNHRLDLLSALLKGEEKERNRLGRELHDGLGGLLSATRLKFQSHYPENNIFHDEIVNGLDYSIHEMRRIAHSLMPDFLEKYGLGEALRQFCISAQNPLLKIDYQSVNVSGDFDKEKELMLFRIAQELINNAMKYADCTEIFVQLQEREGSLYLTVEDNGKGFDPMENNQDKIGYASLKYRVKFLKGTLEIDSQLQVGTSILIVSPL